MTIEEQVRKVIEIMTSGANDDSKVNKMMALYQPWLSRPENFAAPFGANAGEVKRICERVRAWWRMKAESNLIENMIYVSDATLKKIIDQISAAQDKE